jgi:hypothetical protein
MNGIPPKNWRKSPKILIITLAPDFADAPAWPGPAAGQATAAVAAAEGVVHQVPIQLKFTTLKMIFSGTYQYIFLSLKHASNKDYVIIHNSIYTFSLKNHTTWRDLISGITFKDGHERGMK